MKERKTNDEKLVSVLMSSYNEPLEWVIETVESIIAQTYKNTEIIFIVDNPKNRDLISLAKDYEKKYSNFKLILNDQNIGLVSSLNRGLEYVNGNYVARIDADDICKKDRIESQVLYLESKKIDILGGGRSLIDEEGNIISKFKSQVAGSERVAKLLETKDIVYHPSWLVRKEVYEELEGYRNVIAAEDYDFLLRAIVKGYKVDNLNKEVIMYRYRENSISNLNGLRQLITSHYLQKAYKKGEIVDIDMINQKCDRIITDKTVKKYNTGMNYLSKSLNFIRKRRIFRSFGCLIKSLTSSKYMILYVIMRARYAWFEKKY